MNNDLIKYLEGFVSESRLQRFAGVLSERTSHIRIVLENIYQAHNAAAVIRSCDCFGVQHAHFIENRNQLKISDEVAMGSSSWVTIHRHRSGQNNSLDAINTLKDQGYRIVATSPHANGYTLDQLPVDKKIALVFGTELEGITTDVSENADAFVTIPMFGFTESFNISVSAALCMYELTKRIRSSVPDYKLNDEERSEVYLSWLKASIDHSEAIVKDYLQKKK